MIPGNTVCPRCRVSSAGGTGCLCPAVTDSLGVEIRVGDVVRVLAWGAPVRLTDTGRTAVVEGFTAHGNVCLAVSAHDSDPIARGRAVSPGCLGVLDRSDRHNPVAAGYEGNRHLYTGSAK